MRPNKEISWLKKQFCFSLAVMYELVSLAVFAYDIYFLVTKSVDHQCGTNFVSFLFTRALYS